MEESLNRFSERWEILGIRSRKSEMVGRMGIRKFHKETETPNFLGLRISGTGLACLDIDNLEGSVKNFEGIIYDQGINLSDYFVEKTLNGGYHIFFRIPKELKKRNLYGCKKLGVRFDLLYSGRVFTTPSSYESREYRFLNIDPFSIISIDQIQDYTDPLIQLFINGSD